MATFAAGSIKDYDEADFEEAFELFDYNGDGTISISELNGLLKCFGKKTSEKDA